MRKFVVTILLLIPAVALALDFTNVSGRYTDAPFNTAESAGISLLTNLGAVAGNPDGTFMPRRPVNRAEFIKIALSARSSVEVLASDSRDCFPDVHKSDWFSRFVCLGKLRGMVSGYPDGYYHPERTVNYAEALKMLGELYGIVKNNVPAGAWYVPYREGAYNAGVGLPAMEGSMDQSLTRGQVARLVAAYVANSRGELSLYRAAERGEVIASSSSMSSSRSMSSASSDSSVSSVSSSLASSTSSSSSTDLLPDFPASSRFLIAGERSAPIAAVNLFANLEPLYLNRAEVRLKADIDGLDAMYVVDGSGNTIGQLALDKIFDPTEKTWRGVFAQKFYRLEKGEQKSIGFEVRMKPRNQGGTSEETVQVDRIAITADGEWSTTTYTSGTDAGPFPKHQTAMGHIVSVRNAMESTGILPLGPGQQLAAFTITGQTVENVTLRIEDLLFQASKSTQVNVSNWQLGIPDSNERLNCSYNASESAVNCLSIPALLGTLGGKMRTFRLFGDVSLVSGATEKTMQISLNLAGNLETSGAIHWTDESGHFQWVELGQPLARSTLWK